MKKPREKTIRNGARKEAPKWNDLPAAEKLRVARKMYHIARTNATAFGKGKYNIVGSDEHTRLRDRAVIETEGEDASLSPRLRSHLLNLARQAIRNNETMNAILNQFKLNVIGTCGGKAHFEFPEQFSASADALREKFASYCSACEFYDGMNLRDVLSIVLENVLIGGDVVLRFDDSFIENSGRVLGFETDSIANLKECDFKKSYPGKTQTQGRIYTAARRFCGCFVSSSERGKPEFDADKCYAFTCDPNSKPQDRQFAFIGVRRRFNQGRGMPPMASPLGSIIDVEALIGYEVEAAKKNAQTIAQLVQMDATPPSDPSLIDPSITNDELSDSATDAEVEEAVENAVEFEEPAISFDRLKSAGCVYEVMPENAKLELFDTKHPNPNMAEFVRLVSARGGWSLALGSVYTTGKVENSYTGFRGEQIMTWPVFEHWQKFLEFNVCDWIFRRWVDWAGARGELDGIALPDGFRHMVRWTWPKMREVNQVDAQNAWNAGLKNGTLRYSDILGPDWKEQINASAMERAFCEKVGFIHPSAETVSGQIIDVDGTPADEDSPVKIKKEETDE